MDGSTLVTCVHIYLGADLVQGYLCPPVTVSVGFRFHSECITHSLSSTVCEETQSGAAALPQLLVRRTLRDFRTKLRYSIY